MCADGDTVDREGTTSIRLHHAGRGFEFNDRASDHRVAQTVVDGAANGAIRTRRRRGWLGRPCGDRGKEHGNHNGPEHECQ